MRSSYVFLTILALAASGCAASSPVGRAVPALVTGGRPYFIAIGQGLTAASQTEAMQVAPGTFPAYQMNEACRTPRRIERLEAPARTIDLRVGDRLTLSTLRVVAVNNANRVVPGVPVAFDAEELTPPVLSLRSDDPDLAQGRIAAVAPGRYRVRVRTLCTNDSVDLMITGNVLP